MTDFPETSVSQEFSTWATSLTCDLIPKEVENAIGNAVLDYAGLCVSARNLDYVGAMIGLVQHRAIAPPSATKHQLMWHLLP